MKRSSFLLIVCVAFIVLLGMPVSGADGASASVTGAGLTTANVASEPYISVTATPAKAVICEPVTISGVASGGNLTSGVQIWVFAGNYVNVSTVKVNTDGTYSKVYPTNGLPAATYLLCNRAEPR